MRREILVFPDPFLARKAAPVAAVNDRIRALIRDMFETMYAAEGVGLAATQVGVGKRVVVLDVSPVDETIDPIAVVNPEIVSRNGSVTGVEGCLSVPGPGRGVSRRNRRGARHGRAGESASDPGGRDPLPRAAARDRPSRRGPFSSIAFPPPLRPSRSDPPVARSRRRPVAHGVHGNAGIRRPFLADLAEAVDVTLVLCNPDRPAGRGRSMAAPPVKEEAVRRGSRSSSRKRRATPTPSRGSPPRRPT